jgi:asparagine synthase (glutamine-hydrolysing)
MKTKIVLRQLMKPKLPPAILKRPKIGLDIPIHEWFRGILLPLLSETLNQTALEETGLFDWPAVHALMEQHRNRKANWGYHLWGLLTLVLWLKEWKVETPGRNESPLLSVDDGAQEAPSISFQPVSYSA